jgi:hypothetical protein
VVPQISQMTQMTIGICGRNPQMAQMATDRTRPRLLSASSATSADYPRPSAPSVDDALDQASGRHAADRLLPVFAGATLRLNAARSILRPCLYRSKFPTRYSPRSSCRHAPSSVSCGRSWPFTWSPRACCRRAASAGRRRGRLHRLRQTIPDVKSVEDNAKELDAIYRGATD